MGQMAAQVEGLSLFLVLAFCAAVTAVREVSEGPKAQFYGPFIAFIYIQYQQVSKLKDPFPLTVMLCALFVVKCGD